MIDRENNDRLRKMLDEQFGTSTPHFGDGSKDMPDCCIGHAMDWLRDRLAETSGSFTLSAADRGKLVALMGVVEDGGTGIGMLDEAMKKMGATKLGEMTVDFDPANPVSLGEAVAKAVAKIIAAGGMAPNVANTKAELLAPLNFDVFIGDAEVESMVGPAEDLLRAEPHEDGVYLKRQGVGMKLTPTEGAALAGALLSWMWNTDMMDIVKQQWKQTSKDGLARVLANRPDETAAD